MHNTLVFVVEKPAAVRALAERLSAKWPDARLCAITTLYVGLHQFRYPRGLGYGDLPFIAEPSWKPRSLDANGLTPAWEIQNGVTERINEDPAELLRGATEIWYAADPDPSGAIAYHVMLSQALGEAVALQPRPAIRLMAWDKHSIEAAFAARGTTADPWFIENRNAGMARRFFDFNFNINAFVLLGDVLRRALGSLAPNPNEFSMSKYSLQLLYGLQERHGMTETGLLDQMIRWKGTGRYQPSEMGSPASRWKIIEDLQDAGLISSDDGRVELTANGRSFLQQLHPDCRDADLPARMRHWEAAWPDSRPGIERYLRTFFGKQKRFAQSASTAPEHATEVDDDDAAPRMRP